MSGDPAVRPIEVPTGRVASLTLAALLCFALNSLLCRAALGAGRIDATSFTLARLLAGATVLILLAYRSRSATPPRLPAHVSPRDRAISALALFLYALPFSLAYSRISAGTGAFVVFGCVQITMIGSDLIAGRRVGLREGLGLMLAALGLFWLTRPGAASPDLVGVLLMAISGGAWGIYSIRGRTSGPPLQATARNFAAATLLALVASALTLRSAHLSASGLGLAHTSGAITSGLGYVAWYTVLPSLSSTRAAILQLAVPPLAAILGIGLLGETMTARLWLGAPLILGGIAVAVSGPRR